MPRYYGHSVDQLDQRYQLGDLLGSGAMADVYLAWDEQEKRKVAIKIIKPDVLNTTSFKRFRKEGEMVAGLAHPHILHVYGVDFEFLDAIHGSTIPYIIMEYISGDNLKKRLIPDKPYPLVETLQIFEQVCSAVQYAHEQGVIHRDIKPANILFRRLPDGSEQCVLSDFGLAVFIDATHLSYPQGGTPVYMSPEQHQGQPQKVSDIFALGVLLYQLCTGKLPFRQTYTLKPLTPLQYPSILNTALPADLDEVISKALAEDPAQRFPSAKLFLEQVEAAVKNDVSKTVPSSLPSDQMPTIQPESIDVSAAKASSVHKAIQEEVEPAFENLPAMQDVATSDVVKGTISATVPPMSVHNGISISAYSAKMEETSSFVVGKGNTSPLPVAEPIKTKVDNLNVVAPSNMRRRWIAVVLVLIALLMVGGSIIYAYLDTKSNGSPGSAVQTSQTLSPATVTITPDSHLISNSYIVTGANGNPDPTKLQISARQLTASAQSGSITVNGTGHAGIPGTQAVGKLTFYNSLSVSQTIARGTTFTLANGIEITTDELAVIPAANPPTNGLVTVSAHAVTAGTAGDIAALALNNQPCCVTGVTVQNTQAFTGGQDPKNYHFVTPADVNAAADGQRMTIAQQAVGKLKGQFVQGETLTSSPQCTTSVKAGQVGDTGVNVTSTSAVVSANCSAQVYNLTQLQTLMKNQLQGIADKNYGPGYVLAGNVAINTKIQQAADGAAGTLMLLTDDKGMWYYNVTQQQEAAFAKLIASKPVNAAVVQLQGEKSIAKATIQINGGGTTLPTDPTQISFVVEPITGLSTATTPVSSTPTITNGTGNSSSTTPAVVGG